jgi:hypothetical protein
LSLVLTPAPVSTAAEPLRRRRKSPDALVIAVLATVISGIGASRPSLWFDEAATISASTHRSLPELWRLLTHIDGRLAPIPLISVATTAITTASGGVRRRPGGAAAVLTGARVSTWLNGVPDSLGGG